ncbi:MAG: hypothetical protein LBP95_03080 [Deltaproteobacteria bacterium]|jgi:hypothetical protein|nr:hypothetical protein [Deltaproteobacteria bacterium]
MESLQDLNHAQIKCRVIPTALNHELAAFSQNVRRADLTIMEKAEHLGKLFSRIKSDKNDAQQKDLIPLVSLSESYISELMKISKLDDEIRTEALRSRSLTRAKLMQLADIKNQRDGLKNLKSSNHYCPSMMAQKIRLMNQSVKPQVKIAKTMDNPTLPLVMSLNSEESPVLKNTLMHIPKN